MVGYLMASGLVYKGQKLNVYMYFWENILFWKSGGNPIKKQILPEIYIFMLLHDRLFGSTNFSKIQQFSSIKPAFTNFNIWRISLKDGDTYARLVVLLERLPCSVLNNTAPGADRLRWERLRNLWKTQKFTVQASCVSAGTICFWREITCL